MHEELESILKKLYAERVPHPEYNTDSNGLWKERPCGFFVDDGVAAIVRFVRMEKNACL